MSRTQPSILIATAFQTELLDDAYAVRPGLIDLDFAEQSRELLAADLGIVDAYASGLRALGCETTSVVVNADHLQGRWAIEHGVRRVGNIHDRRRRILSAQLDYYRADVLLVFEWSPLGDAFLAEVRSKVRLVVGQLASHLPDNRTFAAYDLVLSSWPPLVDYFRAGGKEAVPFRLGFDERVGQIASTEKHYDVTFVGGLGPAHENRVLWLERLSREIEVDVFGYGRERLDAESAVGRRHHGFVWGRRMFEVLGQSRVTLNLHYGIKIRGRKTNHLANNMRLYEATGMGTCLLTDAKTNLAELFEPGLEVLTFEDEAECIDKVRYYLTHEDERLAIARAGQERTLGEHTYSQRMVELLGHLRAHIDHRSNSRVLHATA